MEQKQRFYWTKSIRIVKVAQSLRKTTECGLQMGSDETAVPTGTVTLCA